MNCHGFSDGLHAEWLDILQHKKPDCTLITTYLIAPLIRILQHKKQFVCRCARCVAPDWNTQVR